VVKMGELARDTTRSGGLTHDRKKGKEKETLPGKGATKKKTRTEQDIKGAFSEKKRGGESPLEGFKCENANKKKRTLPPRFTEKGRERRRKKGKGPPYA